MARAGPIAVAQPTRDDHDLWQTIALGRSSTAQVVCSQISDTTLTIELDGDTTIVHAT